MTIDQFYLKERRTDDLEVYSPFEPPTTVVVGLAYMGKEPPGDVVGEYWWDGELHIELYKGKYADSTP